MKLYFCIINWIGLLDIILSYRGNEIKNLEDLNVLIDDEKFAEISGMFTTGSTFWKFPSMWRRKK